MNSGNRHKYSHCSKKTNVANRTGANQNNADASTISTKRHFKVNKISSDKSASQQSKPIGRNKPFSPGTLSDDKLAETDSTQVKSKNYSSRNMLRDSRTDRMTGQSGSHAQQTQTTSNNRLQEDSLLRNIDDLNCYTKLAPDCFTYESQANAIICLLCGCREFGKTVEHHIDSSYHLSQFRKLDTRLLNEELDESSLQMRTIKALCDNWCSTYSLTDSHIQARNFAIAQLEAILGFINPECQFRKHGSSYYGAATTKSDVNLELVHPNSRLFESDPRSKNSIHHKLIDPDAEYGNQYNQHTMHYDLVSNPVETLFKIYRNISESHRSLPSYPFTVTSSLDELNRKIPKITLEHSPTGTIINVNCYSEERFNLAQLLHTYMLLDSRLERLSKLITIWANKCGIDNPNLGSYPPHAYVVMMIYFLQRTEPPVLPCLHELVTLNGKHPNQSINGGAEQPGPKADRIIGTRDEDNEEDEEDSSTKSNIDESALSGLDWQSKNISPVHVLFIQFFKTMIDEFSMLSRVITIRTLKPVLPQFNTQSKVIEHPINPKISISRSITSLKTFDFIKDSFFHTYFYLTSIPIGNDLKPRTLIKVDPRDYINLYVNIYKLNFYREMKEEYVGKARYDPISQMIQQRIFARDVETLHALSDSNHESSLSKTLANLYNVACLRPMNMTNAYSCWLCRSAGHPKEKCPKGLIEKLEDERATYNFDLDEAANIDYALMKLYNDEAISTSLSLKHNKVLSTLKSIINDALGLNLNFVLYGSTVNNLGSFDSDLDICVTVKNNPTGKNVNCVEILKGIQAVLETIVEVRDIQPVFTARVPIIRFKYDEFDIDMSMYNQCAIYNSKLLKAYSLIEPKVAPLCYLVKKFAKSCGIADASRGSLSSYAWSLLVIYFLQQLEPQILPVLQEPIDNFVSGSFGVNGWNVWFHDKPVASRKHPYTLTHLLKLFYLFYGVFDFKNNVVSIRKSATITKFQKSWVGCMIAIEDPFELTYNLANRLSDPMAIFILNSFAQIFRHIVDVQRTLESRGGPIRAPASDIAKMLFRGTKITKVGPPLRGCLNCHKIGHFIKECPEKKNDLKRSPQKNKGRAHQNGK